MLYLVSLIFLLFQDAHDARLLLKVTAQHLSMYAQVGVRPDVLPVVLPV